MVDNFLSFTAPESGTWIKAIEDPEHDPDWTSLGARTGLARLCRAAAVPGRPGRAGVRRRRTAAARQRPVALLRRGDRELPRCGPLGRRGDHPRQRAHLRWGVMPALLAWLLLPLPAGPAFAGFALLFVLIRVVSTASCCRSSTTATAPCACSCLPW